MKLIVIGHQEAVWGFGLVGVEGYIATGAEQLERALDAALADKSVGIILITQDVAGLAETRIAQLKAYANVPLVLEIPPPGGPDPNRPSLSDAVRHISGMVV